MNDIFRTIALASLLTAGIPLVIGTAAGGIWLILALDLPGWTWLVLAAATGVEGAALALLARSTRRVDAAIALARGTDPLEQFLSQRVD